MPKSRDSIPPIAGHGALTLPSVTIDSVNVELRDGDDFIGDRASSGAFYAIIEELREKLRAYDQDPLGEVETDELGKSRLNRILTGDKVEAAALVQGAVEKFAGELAFVTRRFLRLKDWRDTERIVIGGGFRQSRIGELAVSRAEQMLKEEELGVDLVPISNHPDEAGLLGGAHLAPAWVLAGHDGMLAVDIGGSNIRAGIVKLNLRKGGDLAKAKVWQSILWRHAEEEPGRDEAVQKLVGMLEELIAMAQTEKLALAPFIGIGCPGLILEDGSIDRGGQNLPGNWESRRFNLPQALREAIPRIGDHETAVVMHNDAVVQGLSEVPAMADVERWGVFTIGTGLGNARFTNRRAGGE
ncbi:MAG: ROK family protein [Reyranellaceae bacterium]